MVKNRMSDQEIIYEYNSLSKLDMPPVTDNRWRAWTLPLQRYLSEPRTMKQIEDWASRMELENYKLINLLAWLSYKSIVQCEGKLWSIDFT